MTTLGDRGEEASPDDFGDVLPLCLQLRASKAARLGSSGLICEFGDEAIRSDGVNGLIPQSVKPGVVRQDDLIARARGRLHRLQRQMRKQERACIQIPRSPRLRYERLHRAESEMEVGLHGVGAVEAELRVSTKRRAEAPFPGTCALSGRKFDGSQSATGNALPLPQS